MKVVLVKPPATYADWYRRPQIGISYIAAHLKRYGIDCNIVDAYYRALSSQETVKEILSSSPDIVGFTAMTHEIVEANNIAAMLKKQSQNIATVVGGPHITALPRETLKEFTSFDYGIYGEGEKTMLELAVSFKEANTKLAGNIAGLVCRNNGDVLVNESRAPLTPAELDNLPYPAYSLYYGNNPKALCGNKSYYVMFTSRGCPFECVFCMQVLGRQVRRRSPENILKEIDYAISKFGAHTFDFADEIFLADNPHTFNLLNLMISTGISQRIKWKALTRANFVTQELISLAKRAGCYRLEMGVESGDNSVLKAIKKNITIKEIMDAVDIIKKAKVSLGTYYILGHPNETKDTAKKTIDLAVKLNTDSIAVGIMVPYPGTAVYKMALAGNCGYRLLNKDWSQFDKYGGEALELEQISHKELVIMQYKSFILFYLYNQRFLDLFKYIFEKRKAIIRFSVQFLKKKFTRLS